MSPLPVKASVTSQKIDQAASLNHPELKVRRFASSKEPNAADLFCIAAALSCITPPSRPPSRKTVANAEEPTQDNAIGIFQAVEKIEFQDVPECSETVHRGDLLALFVGSPSIRDRHFVNRAFQLANFRCDFDLEAEARAFDNHVANDLAPKGLIARFHVRHIDVCEQI